MRYHYKMTSQSSPPKRYKRMQNLEEFWENSRVFRRVVNRILDRLHEYAQVEPDYDPESIGWTDPYDEDDKLY